jgi:hypothetical protein
MTMLRLSKQWGPPLAMDYDTTKLKDNKVLKEIQIALSEIIIR